MDFVGVLIAVQVVTGAGSAGVNLVPLGVFPLAECRQRVTDYSALPQQNQFTKDGKIIMSEEYQCAILEDKELTEVLNQLES